jgi:transposase-like protein
MATLCSTRNRLFLGRWFQDEVIIVAVRWYLTYPLSYRQVCDATRSGGVGGCEHRQESGEILYQKMRVRSCAYLHHVVEQDHGRVKRRVNAMLGFQSFENARVVIAGIELAQKISQRPHELRRWGGTDTSQAQVWQRVMVA